MQKAKATRSVRHPGQKTSVTIKDIASALGISFQAVSQALNPRRNTSQVSEATRQRVQETAAKMGYRSHPAARILRAGRSGQLGVLIFDHPHQTMRHRLHYVLSEIRAAGYRPIIHLADTQASSDTMETCLTMVDAKVEGVVLVDPVGFPKEAPIEMLLKHQIPVVSIGSHQWKSIVSYQADRKQGYFDLTRHLIEAGCRSLTLLCSEATPKYQQFFSKFLEDMQLGFQEAAAEAQASGSGRIKTRIQTAELGIDCEDNTDSPVHLIHRAGYLGTKRILMSDRIPDAILCQADSFAQGALRACFEAGLGVPDDLMLTGFNNEPASSAGQPPLTTIAQPYAEIARRAVTELAAQIREESRNEPGRIVTLPGHLIIRASSLRSKILPPRKAQTCKPHSR